MAASKLSRSDTTAVIVGADRIARNGDTANKIGTYHLALAAKAHGVPFYVAAPRSTYDPATVDGRGIPIEMRRDDELKRLGVAQTGAEEAAVWNPAFDVTPVALITAFITDRGILRPEDLPLWCGRPG
jgi:methylthioribose-1-phosphate isomerase